MGAPDQVIVCSGRTIPRGLVRPTAGGCLLCALAVRSQEGSFGQPLEGGFLALWTQRSQEGSLGQPLNAP